MVIWRGWGILAFIYALLAGLLFGGLASTFLSDELLPFSLGVGMLAAAAATWFTGQALNGSGPQRKIDEWHQARQQQLHQLVESGRFTMGPGQPPPASLDEARQQSEQLLAAELQQAKRARNQHTLFFVPMQWIAVVLVGIAIVAFVFGVIGMVSA